jgi:hypothetical protein
VKIESIMAMADEVKHLLTSFEMIDGPTLAERWKVKPCWIRKQTGAFGRPVATPKAWPLRPLSLGLA